MLILYVFTQTWKWPENVMKSFLSLIFIAKLIWKDFHFLGLKNREERERQYFDTGLPATSSALMNEDVVEDDELYDRVS